MLRVQKSYIEGSREVNCLMRPRRQVGMSSGQQVEDSEQQSVDCGLVGRLAGHRSALDGNRKVQYR